MSAWFYCACDSSQGWVFFSLLLQMRKTEREKPMASWAAQDETQRFSSG